MVVFNPPYNFRQQLGQDATAVPAPAAPAAPAAAPSGPNYDKSLITLTPAGVLVGGVVLLGIAFSLAGAFAKR